MDEKTARELRVGERVMLVRDFIACDRRTFRAGTKGTVTIGGVGVNGSIGVMFDSTRPSMRGEVFIRPQDLTTETGTGARTVEAALEVHS